MWLYQQTILLILIMIYTEYLNVNISNSLTFSNNSSSDPIYVYGIS